MKRLSWFVLFSILAISCLDTPDCYQLNNNYLGVVFKIIGGGTDWVYLNSVASPGAAELILKDSVVTGSVGLTLNPYANEGTFSFDGNYITAPPGVPGPKLELKKALNITYLARVQFVSEDCGERHVFTDVDTLSSDFDAIRILNNVPANPATTNIELHRCPRTNLMYLDFVGDVPVKTVSVQETGDSFEITSPTISGIVLPLIQESDSTTFNFLYTNGAQKKLTVRYSTIPKAKFEQCGTQTFINGIKPSARAGSVTFSKVTVLEDSIYDLPTKVNLEITP